MAELNKATRHLNNAKLGINVDWLDFDGKIDISLAIVCYLCCLGSLIISFLVLYLCYVISGESFKETVSCFFMTKWLSKLAGLIEGCK